jgi:hypothetical protein
MEKSQQRFPFLTADEMVTAAQDSLREKFIKVCRSQCIDRQERAPASYLTFALPLSVQSVPTSRLSMSTPKAIWSHSWKACVLRSVHRWPSTANVAVLSHRSTHQPYASRPFFPGRQCTPAPSFFIGKIKQLRGLSTGCLNRLRIKFQKARSET